MPPSSWVDRAWDFEFPVSRAPELIERLRVLPMRVEELVEGRDVKSLAARRDGKWSAQEHIGHLADLDPLLGGRITDFLSGREILRAADMSNQATEEARHNDLPLRDAIGRLWETRGRLVETLLELDEPVFRLTARHPRLGRTIRLVDMVYFHAEHDDHHLAWMREIVEGLGNG